MVQGKDHQRSLDLVFHDAPVKLRLVKGSGPVHLVGAHGVGEYLKINLILFSCHHILFIFLAYRYMGEDDSSDDEDGMGEEMEDEEDEQEV